MKKDRSVLENKLFKYFDSIIEKPETLENYKKFLVSKGYTEGEVMRVVGRDNPPKTLNDVDLFMFTLASEYANQGLKVSNFYNDSEIEDMDGYVKINQNIKDEEMVFENVFKIDDRTYKINNATLQQIASYVDSFYIGYDIRYQRETIKKKVRKEIREDINIKESKWREIANLIVNNKYFPDDITLCLYKTGEENFDYDEKNHRITIKIDENTKPKCPDGWHRLMGFRAAVNLNPNIEHNECITFIYATEKEIGEYIAQKDKHTPLLKSHAKLFTTDDPYMEIAKGINTDGGADTNFMFNKIVADRKDLSIYTDKLCTFETIAKAIEYTFDTNDFDARSIKRIKDFIVEGMNEILGAIKDLGFTKENSVCYENNMFIGYISILSGLYKKYLNKEKWINDIEDILLKFNFSNGNDDWKIIELSNTNITRPTMKRITNYFSERSNL